MVSKRIVVILQPKNQDNMADNKNQHFIPQFYQKYFSDDGKNISLFVVDTGKTIERASIKKQSSESYFYSEDTGIEKELGKVERLMAILLKKLSEGNYKLDDKELSVLYTFICLQSLRTEVPAEELRNMAEQFAKEYANFITHDETFTNNLVVKIPHPPLKSLEHLDEMIQCCLDLKWKFLIIESGEKNFITSDNPVSYYNTFLEKKGLYKCGYGLVGTLLFLPLSPKLAVILYDSQIYKVGSAKNGGSVVLNNSDVDNFNELTAVNANKVIYYKRGSISDETLKKISAIIHKYEKDVCNSNSSTLQGANHYIQYFHSSFPRLKLTFSFIKQLDKARAINVGSPEIVRPHVRYIKRQRPKTQ